MTSVTICIHDFNNMFRVMYLSAPCLYCVFHGLSSLTFSWQMFGFLRFKWKINYCSICKEFCTMYWFKFSWVYWKTETTCKMGDLWRLPTSDQSRASHSGGQLWLLQGSVGEGRWVVHAESSRTFSSVTEILLLHNTSRVRRPPLQLRLHSDHSPVHQLAAERGLFCLHYII